MTPNYRLAHLTPDQMLSIENLENDLGITLIAWEPNGQGGRDTATNNLETDADGLVLDALNDTYRTYDPHI
ncbi:MAG TPA: hypothetical protein VNT75_20145 [Symbiobacteriaceae bacterium]|nr:hypothetical protein [Symbiobacteriaceae bacterium]